MNTKSDTSLKDMPFGRPFASQMSQEEILDNFFKMPNMDFSFYSGSFAFTSRRGGGKTHLLRKKHAEYSASNDLPPELVLYESTSLSTEYILDKVRKYDQKELAYHLKAIWEMVLAIRIATIFYYAIEQGLGQFDSHLIKKLTEDIRDWLKKAGLNLDTGKSISAIYNALVIKFSSRHQGETEFLSNFNRREFISFLKDINLTAFLFVDDTDDSYHESPRFWDLNLSCLYETIMFLRKELPKFHVIVAMRREVYDYIQHHNPSWTRIAGRDNVKDIAWNKRLLRLLLEKKISALHKRYFSPRSKFEDPVYRFLGVSSIENLSIRGKTEDVFDYILRHTFYRARDLVYMGNDIWLQIRKVANRESVKCDPNAEELKSRIRKGVHLASKAIAEEIISECDSVIRDLAPGGYNGPSPTLMLLRLLPMTIIEKSQFDIAIEKLKGQYPGLADILPYNILAKWGLLGWVSREANSDSVLSQRFNFETHPNEPRIRELPEASFYVMHPALDHLEEITASVQFSIHAIVGQHCDFPQLSHIPKVLARPPFQLDWIEPQIIDRDGYCIKLPKEHHDVLRGLFGVKDIHHISDLFVVKAIDTSNGAIVPGEYDPNDVKVRSRQFARYLRRILRNHGIYDKDSIIRNVRGKGYTKGKDWSTKKPLKNRSQVPEILRDTEPYPAEVQEIRRRQNKKPYRE